MQRKLVASFFRTRGICAKNNIVKAGPEAGWQLDKVIAIMIRLPFLAHPVWFINISQLDNFTIAIYTSYYTDLYSRLNILRARQRFKGLSPTSILSTD